MDGWSREKGLGLHGASHPVEKGHADTGRNRT